MKRFEEKDAKPAAPPPAPVVVARVERRTVEVWGEWVASITGSVDAAIRPRVNGYLIAQIYQEGSPVKAGDLMFEIDPRPFEAALAQAKAQLARSQAEQAKSQLDVDRYTPLAAKRAVSQQELDDAIGNNNANLAQIKANEAEVEQAELNLAFTRIIAPIDGIAGMANAQIGDLVGPLTPVPLTTVSTVNPFTVYFFPTEREYLLQARSLEPLESIPLADRPAKFELILDDRSTFAERGRFSFIDRQVEVLTGTIRVGAQFDNPGNIIRPGQFGRIRVIQKDLPDAIVVPQRAVIDVQGSSQIAIVKADNTIELRSVELGPRSGSDWVIAKGLEGNETIVLEGIQRLRNGTKVAPQLAPPPSVQAPAASAGTASGSAR